MSTNVKHPAQCLAHIEAERGTENWKPHEIFGTSLFRPQGISTFLNPYRTCYFSPTKTQNKSTLVKVAISLISLCKARGTSLESIQSPQEKNFEIHSCKMEIFRLCRYHCLCTLHFLFSFGFCNKSTER